jgi:DNA-binding transcriptional ArsR family regulator
MFGAVSNLFAVVAEPSRRQILDRLLQSEASVTELIAVIGVSQTAMSKHLRVLKAHNLVTSRIDAQRRIYALDSRPLAEIDEWLAGYRRTWDGRIDSLAEHLDRLHLQPQHPQPEHPAEPSVQLEETP